MRFEKLGQRLRIAGGMLVAGAVGGSGTWLARPPAGAPGSAADPPGDAGELTLDSHGGRA